MINKLRSTSKNTILNILIVLTPMARLKVNCCSVSLFLAFIIKVLILDFLLV